MNRQRLGSVLVGAGALLLWFTFGVVVAGFIFGMGWLVVGLFAKPDPWVVAFGAVWGLSGTGLALLMLGGWVKDD